MQISRIFIALLPFLMITLALPLGPAEGDQLDDDHIAIPSFIYPPGGPGPIFSDDAP
ncbi:hypothetical protein GALMADRAFT_139615 [Galerina marginata CBS 339.88]|uniref:Uncharacterized protein n=1 Tax=Galerina marginata (strain CBS 339.88) TaxID=685588 RepID=A0A067T9Y7_GALM3|nr:hypothetical protein GALMADRAFT_139615 [Galerina marginata CBS 339.88]